MPNHKLLLQQYKKERVNPQFIQMSKKCIQKRKQRKQIEANQLTLAHHVMHLDKLNDQLASTLSKKSIQLKYIKEVRGRYLTDLQKKAEKQQKINGKLEQLRDECLRSRAESIRNIQDALISIKHKNQTLSKEVKSTLNKLKQQFSIKKYRIDITNQSLFKQMQSLKSYGKQKLNRCCKQQNSILLKSYRHDIFNERSLSDRAQQQIQTLRNRQNRYKTKIQNKEEKLAHITREIEILRHTDIQKQKPSVKFHFKIIHVPSQL